MVCPVNKIDSNATGLAYAEEECLKVLPGVDGADAVWHEFPPNSYADFGATISAVAKDTINASRQRQKGTSTGIEATGGVNNDFSLTNMIRPLQGFFFADAREKTSTAPLNGTAVAMTAVDDVTDAYQAASGLGAFLPGALIKASNFGDSANDGLAKVLTVTATDVVVDKALVAEVAPPATSLIEACGFEFPTGDIDITASASSITLSSAATDFTTLGLNIGEWIFVGGDAAVNQFDNNAPGYARIIEIETDTLHLDETTWVPVTEIGGAKDIQLFFGTVIRNEKDPALIKRRSYNLERTLGQDENGTQSEYLEGAIANEFTLNVPLKEKLTSDITYIAMNNSFRDGTTGVKVGTRVPAVQEDLLNTSSDVYRMKVNIVDPVTLNPTSLFAYLSEVNLSINNNVTPNEAIGVYGAFDATAGNFEVSGSVTAYFSTVEAAQAVKDYADVAMNLIFAQENGAAIFDVPLLALDGGSITVEKDAAITIPVETNGAECQQGYTLLSSFLPYVPDVAMPKTTN